MGPDEFIGSEEHESYMRTVPAYRRAITLAVEENLAPEVSTSFFVYLEAGETQEDAANFALDDWGVPLRKVEKPPPRGGDSE
jgi:hypothetical protein